MTSTGRRCPACLDDLPRTTGWVVCRWCTAPHHARCWRSGCAACGDPDPPLHPDAAEVEAPVLSLTSTYGRQEVAARKLRELAEAQAAAEKQTQLTQTAIDVQVAANRGEAELAEARRLAERDVVRAEGESKARELVGKGEAARIAQTGQAEALVARQKVEAFGDPRLLALQAVAGSLSGSGQALVPERVVQLGQVEGGHGLVGQLLGALTRPAA